MQALEAGATERLAKRALRAAYTPTGLMQPLGLAEDPLGFTNDFLRASTGVAGNTRLEGNVLVAERDGREFVLVLTENEGHPFASATQERVIPAIARARLAASQAIEGAGGDRRFGRHPARERRGRARHA